MSCTLVPGIVMWLPVPLAHQIVKTIRPCSMHQMRSKDYLQDILGVKAPLSLGHVCHTLSKKGYVMGY